MESQKNDAIGQKIEEIKVQIDGKRAKALELDLLIRIASRLQSFDCAECTSHLANLEEYVRYLHENVNAMDDQEVKKHQKKMGEIKTHLQKKHGLVEEGYYLSIYMSLGMSIGLVFGLTIFDNLALGLPIGMAIGVAVGSGMDADNKKKGKTL